MVHKIQILGLTLVLVGNLNGAAAVPVPHGRELLDTFVRDRLKSLQEIAFMKLVESSQFCAMRFAVDRGIFSLAESYSTFDLNEMASACVNDADIKKFNTILCASVLPRWKHEANEGGDDGARIYNTQLDGVIARLRMNAAAIHREALVPLVFTLLHAGLNPNIRFDNYGNNTLLIYAAGIGYMEIVHALIAAGA